MKIYHHLEELIKYKYLLFSLQQYITPYLNSFKTKNGETQISEKKYKKFITDFLVKNNILFTQSGSQQSGDIIIQTKYIRDIILELKKTDKYIIMLNDTPPNKKYIYIL